MTKNISMGGEEHLLQSYAMCEQQNIISLISHLPARTTTPEQAGMGTEF